MSDLIPIGLQSLDQSLQDATRQLGKRSKRIYVNDAQHFGRWILEQGVLAVCDLTRSHMAAYREHLEETYQPATAARMLSVARRILEEQVRSGHISSNPAEGIRGFDVADESPYIALTKQQARELLDAIDRTSAKGLRDYALILVLLRTGIRCMECAALQISDLGVNQGHHILTVQQGKGKKRRTVKLPVVVYRAIEEYFIGTGRNLVEPGVLFAGVNKWGQSTSKGISEKQIERIVKERSMAIDIEITPHAARTSFITLALEGGAKLEQVQYAAGHSDPRTTERYQRRKLNLDDNAVDYVHF